MGTARASSPTRRPPSTRSTWRSAGWALVGLAVTGDPLHSLHATSELADELNRTKGIGALPHAFVKFLADTVRAPVALGAAIGVVLALALRGWRAIVVPLALVA